MQVFYEIYETLTMKYHENNFHHKYGYIYIYIFLNQEWPSFFNDPVEIKFGKSRFLEVGSRIEVNFFIIKEG